MVSSHINVGAMGTAFMVLGVAMTALGVIGFLRVFSVARGEAWRTVLFGLGNALFGYGIRSRQSWEGPTPAVGWLGVMCMTAPVTFVIVRWLYSRFGSRVGHLRDGSRR
jgi:multisubunit Na+/H+ antiporter MnhG subunit